MNNAKKMITAYITKNFISKGIQKKQGIITNSGGLEVSHSEGYPLQWFHEGEWFQTEYEAIENAYERKEALISDLKNKIKYA